MIARKKFPNITVGRGYVTKVHTSQGGLILQETAWFRQSINQSQVPPQYMQTQIWRRLQHIPTIHYGFGRGSDYDRFRANAMRRGMLVPPGAFHEEEALGIFLLATLFNSSCAPNVHAH